MPAPRANFAESEPLPDSPASSDRRLPPLLRRAWFSLNQAFRKRIAHLRLTPDQYTLLRWLEESDATGPTQRELASLMASDANTIASLLARMEAQGLIERVPHEVDRRAKRVRLMPAGRKLFQRARRAALDLQTQVLTALPESERAHFLEQLERVADACRDVLQAKEPRE